MRPRANITGRAPRRTSTFLAVSATLSTTGRPGSAFTHGLSPTADAEAAAATG
jgi:hypothetical protein